MKAKEVLEECKRAKIELKASLETDDLQLIRIRWVTCLNFLRMVGHVIDKVDKYNFPDQASTFKSFYDKKKSDDIFVHLIEKERNLALKQYELMVTPKKVSYAEPIVKLTESSEVKLTHSSQPKITEQKHQFSHYALKSGTYGEGERLDDIIDSGIDWWEQYIMDLEKKITTYNKS